MIFVNANIPMYLVGAPHPNKDGARLLIERCIAEGQRLGTDAEVFQEMLRRYSAISGHYAALRGAAHSHF